MEENQDNLNCLLRNDLNPDCLAEIFNNLEVADLVTLGSMDDHYKQIINDNIIHKKTIYFHAPRKQQWFSKPASGEIINSLHSNIFKMYGKRIRNFSFYGNLDDFDHLLQQIKKYCSKHSFKNITLDFSPCTQDYMWLFDHSCFSEYIQRIEAAAEYFNEIESFSCVRGFGFFMVDFIRMFPKLQVLKLENIKCFHLDTLFEGELMMNLKELHLIEMEVFFCPVFIDFLRQRPNLEHFVNRNSILDNVAIGKTMAEYCGDKMKSFCDIDKKTNHFTRSSDVKLYPFMSKFEHLKEATLTSSCAYVTDLIEPIMELAQHNTLEKLVIFQKKKLKTQPIRQIKINEFTKLKTIEIEFENFNRIENKYLELLIKYLKVILPHLESVIAAGHIFKFQLKNAGESAGAHQE